MFEMSVNISCEPIHENGNKKQYLVHHQLLSVFLMGFKLPIAFTLKCSN